MIEYIVIVVVVLAAGVSGKFCLECAGLRKTVERQNTLLKKNLAELRDEYARLNREMKKDKKRAKK